MRINLTDNNIGLSDGSNIFKEEDVADLKLIAKKTVRQLCQDNENLIIFPHSVSDTADKIEDQIVLDLSYPDKGSVQVLTGNLMGFIGVGGLQIKIKSRFDNGRDDFLLHYMLQRVMSFNLFDLNHNNEQEDVFDFIMFMFPYFLKNAMRQGVYREYQRFRHNDSHIKGPIDMGRHIAHNVPFVGNVAYSSREYSNDNSMTELIRHTIEYMRTKAYGKAVLDMDNETRDGVKCIIENTTSYNRNDRNAIIQKNLRHKSHPYYTEYTPLQSLCVQILRMEEVKYGDSEDEICGILFDGAWLWEEYVNTIVRDLGFQHPENKLSKGAIYLFENPRADGKIRRSGMRYPDFYRDDFVLDAKYKKLGSYDRVSMVGRDDIHQVIAYMTCLGAQRGGFVSPLEMAQTKIPMSYLKGTKSTMSIFGICVDKNAMTYSEFCQRMRENELKFVKDICG